jgi:arylsulfatase A-like enzyme
VAAQVLRPIAIGRPGVGRIVEALEDTGRLEDTFIVLTSDHGFLFGEDRFAGKGNPTGSIRPASIPGWS